MDNFFRQMKNIRQTEKEELKSWIMCTDFCVCGKRIIILNETLTNFISQPEKRIFHLSLNFRYILKY